MSPTSVLIFARASTRGSGGCGAVGDGGAVASAPNDNIKAMSSHIPHRPSQLQSWSRRDPAATGHLRERRTTFWLALTLAVAGCGAASYREVRPSEPIGAAARDLRVDVHRVFLTDETIENGVAEAHPDELTRIAAALQVPIEALLEPLARGSRPQLAVA